MKHKTISKLKTKFTYDYVKSRLLYDSASGELFWNPDSSVHKENFAREKLGRKAGTDINGYTIISLDYQALYAHHLVWFLHTGEWPEREIDHINRVKNDNRIENLRECGHCQNLWNQPAKGKNRLKGAYFDKSKKKKPWSSSIMANGKRHFLGYFETEEQAHRAYCAAGEQHHGEFHSGT